MKYEVFGQFQPKVISGYHIYDSSGTTEFRNRPMHNANPNGLFYSGIWERQLWGIPEYGDSGYAGDSGDSDGTSVLETNYYWIRRLENFTAPLGSFDSYNFFDSYTSLIQIAKIENAFDSTGRDDFWSITDTRFLLYQRDSADSYAEFKFKLDSDINFWANSSDSDGSTSDDISEATVSLSTRLATSAFTGTTMSSLIDSAISAGTWDSEFPNLGGAYDTIRNFNLMAHMNKNLAFNPREYDIVEFEINQADYNVESDYQEFDSALILDSTSLGTSEFKYYLRIKDSDFDPKDIETY